MIAALGLASLFLLVPTTTGAYIYWDSEGTDSIGRANNDGSGINQIFIHTFGGPRGLAVDGGHVYWSYSNVIGRADLDGSDINQTFIKGASEPSGVAVDGAHLYWANGNSPANSIGRANLDASAINQSFIGAKLPRGVAVDDDHLYWANIDTNTIGRADLDGTEPNQSFISGVSEPFGIAVDGAHIYWANIGTETISRANLDGTGVEESFISTGVPTGVAVDGAHVYWGNYSAKTIGRANLDGSGVDQAFIKGASEPFEVAVEKSPVPTPTAQPSIPTTPPASLPPSPPSSVFRLARRKLNRRVGTATLTVIVPGPGTLVLVGKAIKEQTKYPKQAGRVTVTVRPSSKAKTKLKHTGRARISETLTYTPTGGEPSLKQKTLTLFKRLP